MRPSSRSRRKAAWWPCWSATKKRARLSAAQTSPSGHWSVSGRGVVACAAGQLDEPQAVRLGALRGAKVGPHAGDPAAVRRYGGLVVQAVAGRQDALLQRRGVDRHQVDLGPPGRLHPEAEDGGPAIGRQGDPPVLQLLAQRRHEVARRGHGVGLLTPAGPGRRHAARAGPGSDPTGGWGSPRRGVPPGPPPCATWPVPRRPPATRPRRRAAATKATRRSGTGRGHAVDPAVGHEQQAGLAAVGRQVPQRGRRIGLGFLGVRVGPCAGEDQAAVGHEGGAAFAGRRPCQAPGRGLALRVDGPQRAGHLRAAGVRLGHGHHEAGAVG